MMMSHPVVGTVLVPTSVVSVINRRGTDVCSDPRNGTHKSLTCEGETVSVLGENTHLRTILTLFGGNIRTFQIKLPISFQKITAHGWKIG